MTIYGDVVSKHIAMFIVNAYDIRVISHLTFSWSAVNVTLRQVTFGVYLIRLLKRETKLTTFSGLYKILITSM